MSRPTLAESVERLQEMVEAVEADLRPRFPDYPPHLVRDGSGRPILLDAYAALVTGLAAIEGAR